MSSKQAKNQIKLFRGIDKEVEGTLVKKFTQKKYQKDEVILFRGDTLDGIYIIKSGSLKGVMLKENGEEHEVEKLGAGSVLASAFIFGDKNTLPVDVIAVEEVAIMYMNKNNFLKLLGENLDLTKNLLDIISNKTQFLTKKIWQNFQVDTIEAKLIMYINKNKKGDCFSFNPSLTEVAKVFNVTRPSLSRVLSKLAKDGLIEKKANNLYQIKKESFLKRNFQ